MKEESLSEVTESLTKFVSCFREEFGRSERRRNGIYYLTGLLLPGERKSIEPLSSRVPGSDVQSLQQFVNQSPWEHGSVQSRLNEVMRRRLRLKKYVIALDDTSLPKKGKMSVGVAHQYCGALGKIANCQSIVSLHACTQRYHFPIGAEVYLPHQWIEDKERLTKSRVPQDKRGFREKWRIALELIDSYGESFSPECMTFDAGYGDNRQFLSALDERDLTFIGAVSERVCFWSLDVPLIKKQKATGRRRKSPSVGDKSIKPLSAHKWHQHPDLSWANRTLPSGEKARVTRVRVREVTTGAYYSPGPERWLLIVQHNDGTYRHYVSNASKTTSMTKLVSWAYQRWKIEQGYQQLKQQLGLGHFEGRSWNGLHHHITLCFMAFCFLLLWKRSKKKLPSLFQQLEDSC